MKRKLKKCSYILQQKIDRNSVPSISANGKIIERVSNFKLLGVVICSDLSWHAHVTYKLQKVNKRIFCIYNLARAGICESDITQVYISIIRSVLEYACPVWHPGLSKAWANKIGRVQKRCLRIIYPERTYTEALLISGLDTLQLRQENITRDLFREIKDENHFTRFYPNEKPHQWLLETRILIKSSHGKMTVFTILYCGILLRAQVWTVLHVSWSWHKTKKT